MSKFLNTLIIGVASGAAAAYFFTTEKVKLLKHVLMKKSLHSKKILKLIKIKWWKKLATTKIWQSILSKTIKQNLKMATSLQMI